jgi:hypothetical protein
MITFLGTHIRYETLGRGVDMPHATRKVLAEIEEYYLNSDEDHEIYYIPFKSVFNTKTLDPCIDTKHPGATFFSENKQLLTFIKLKWG